MRDYTDLTLPELNTLLRERSLATDGSKDSLVSRLEAYDAVNDPSPSPELHPSPARQQEQKHQPRPVSLPHHLPTEPDEDYVDWGDDADDNELDMALKAAAKAADAAEAMEISKLKIAGDNPPRSESNSFAGGDEHHSSQSGAMSPTLIKKVSKSGYKYNSIAATFFPDNSTPAAVLSSAPSAMVSPKSPQKPTSEAPSKPSSRSPSHSTASTKAANSPCSTPATPSKPPPKPLSTTPSNALSRALDLSAGKRSTTATPVKPTPRPSVTVTPIKIAALVQTASASVTTAAPNAVPKVDTLPAPSASATTAGIAVISSKPNLAPKPTVGTSRLRTTQTGFQFNSISALFPGAAVDLPILPVTPTKPQPIANVVVNTVSTYSINQMLTPKEEEAKRLAMRAARFGTKSQDPAAGRGKKHGRSGSSEVDHNAAKERERKLEIEKEKEREKIRQRVTSSAKRQRNDEDDDRRPENYKRHRQPQYRNPASARAHYNPHRRY